MISMPIDKVFHVIVHTNNYLNDRIVSINSIKEYNFLTSDDVMAREIAIKSLIDEWEYFDRQTLQSHRIDVLYCEITLQCYLD